MTYYAHSGSPSDKSDWQRLDEHLFAVAKMAAEMAAPFGLERLACTAGLFHDLGKYTPDFQRRLEGANIRVDHSTAGAKQLLELTTGADKWMAEVIAYAILGHHAGLPDKLNSDEGCFDRRLERPIILDPVWTGEIRAELKDLLPEMAKRFPKNEAGFAMSMMGRMVFSCLVDADFKDTEAFYVALEKRQLDRNWPKLATLIDDFSSRYNAHMGRFASKEGELNQLRRDVLAHVRSKSTEKPGLFTLTVPTGGGKTLASLGFALDHARLHGHSRIIYAIPFTSIIDQTAAIFREILGEEHVLEHHSSIDEEKFEDRRQKDKLKLAMEDWAAPVVVTTTVQLFESLFSARPSKARKLHNIANSIIILDEAQTLPRQLLVPVMRVLEELAANYGCTIVLCTATQPALGKRDSFPEGLPLEGRELAPHPEKLASKLARTTIRHVGEMDDDSLIDALQHAPQALVIVNSRAHALALFRQAQASGLDGLVHMTTRQYAAHRRQILEDVRGRLKDGKPCRLIATSLIEAGVDVDFPVAWRAEAGLDQIIQAAGRVNREGRRPRDESLVNIFKAKDNQPPNEIKNLIGDMKRMINNHADLSSLPAVEEYFKEVYWRMGDGLDEKSILKKFTVKRSVTDFTDFSYRTVGDEFRMIESGLAPVIVISADERDEILKKLATEQISSGIIARKLQTCIVQVPPKARDLLIRNGHVAFASPDLRGDQFAVLESKSLYDPQVGLLWENAAYLSEENMFA